MSLGLVILIVRVREEVMERKGCIFCSSLWNEGTIVCPICKDYKGIMTQSEAKRLYAISFDDEEPDYTDLEETIDRMLSNGYA